MYLIMQDSNRKEWCWELGPVSLIIGRSESCDIRLPDPALSRQHAKVWLEDGAVRLEDLGSRNLLLLNGTPVTSAELRPGDTIEAGLSRFRVSDVPVKGEVAQANLCPTPITLSARLGAYLQEPFGDREGSPTERTERDLRALFHLARAMGAVGSIRELSEILFGNLREHFRTEARWIAWRYSSSDMPHFQAADDGEPIDERAQALLLDVLKSGDAMIKPVVGGAGAARHLETLMAVPLVHRGETLGGFVACSPYPGSIYAEDDLHFALGIAAITAPHVHAVRLAEQLRRDHEDLQARTYEGDTLLGESPTIIAIRNQLARAGDSALAVLILGETGTGKELAARMIHERSPRHEGPYVVVNCAAIPHDLFESEFFGHEKGAFTGATQKRVGRFEEAHGGTLFLDEIGDLSPENQARILRTVETGSFHRVGGEKLIRVDVRVVSATNMRLEEPGFRLDLLHRLNGVTISLPPLRDRPEDIQMLAEHFIRCHQSPRNGGLDATALAALLRHPWPGNVRELRTAIDRAILFAHGDVITATDLSLPGTDVAKSEERTVADCDEGDTFPLRPMAEIERAHIERAIEACDGNIARAATALGLNRATLYRKLAEYGEK